MMKYTEVAGDKPKSRTSYKVGCIIQARMTSKRFPGKVVADLWGHSVIVHVVQGVSEAEGLDSIIVAIPEGDVSNPIEDEVNTYFDIGTEVHIFRGAENDVLGRYYEAATEHKLDYIIRVTGDCPLINKHAIEDVIRELTVLPASGGELADYVTNSHPSRTLPKGLDCEGFSYKLLKEANSKAVLPYDREHVTPWMQKNALFKTIVYDVDRSAVNLCIDWPLDIKRIENMDLSTIGAGQPSGGNVH
jgi:spore coat polysaccharide biosynthesis protein SpsF (cytidylyltransferase family)